MAYPRSELVNDSARSVIGKALGRRAQDQLLKPVAGLNVDILSELTESSYIDLVRWTGLQAHPEKRGKLTASEETPPEGLWNVANHPREWMRRVQGPESRYYRAIGSAEALMLKAADLSQRWLKDVSREFMPKRGSGTAARTGPTRPRISPVRWLFLIRCFRNMAQAGLTGRMT